MSLTSEPPRKRPSAYVHLSGLVGAATLLNVLKDVVEWRGFILGFVLWWQTHVRPIFRAIFWWAPDLWPWPWPEWGYDYVALSLVFGLGGVRFFGIFFPLREFLMYEPNNGQMYGHRIVRKFSWSSLVKLTTLYFVVSILWPLFIVFLLLFFFISWINDGLTVPVRDAMFLALSPFFYFLVALMLNYALFFAGVT